MKERNSKLTIVTGVSGAGDIALVCILVWGLRPAIRWSKKVMMAACTSFSGIAVLPRLIAFQVGLVTVNTRRIIGLPDLTRLTGQLHNNQLKKS
ncbi:MAG: hypothetical protein AB3A66_05895 [Nodularia sp. CChRGM 3473]